MEATEATNTNRRGGAMTTTNTIEDFLSSRAAWKAAGSPADHPYLTQEVEAVTYEPLAISLTAAQSEAMKALSPIMRAQSDANIAARR